MYRTGVGAGNQTRAGGEHGGDRADDQPRGSNRRATLHAASRGTGFSDCSIRRHPVKHSGCRQPWRRSDSPWASAWNLFPKCALCTSESNGEGDHETSSLSMDCNFSPESAVARCRSLSAAQQGFLANGPCDFPYREKHFYRIDSSLKNNIALRQIACRTCRYLLSCLCALRRGRSRRGATREGQGAPIHAHRPTGRSPGGPCCEGAGRVPRRSRLRAFAGRTPLINSPGRALRHGIDGSNG